MKENIDSQIIKLLKKKPDNLFSTNQLLKELNIPKQNRNSLKRILRNLVANGDITRLKGGRFKLNSHLDKTKKQPRIKKAEKQKNGVVPLDRKFLAKVIKRENSYFLVPRNEYNPVLKLEDAAKGKQMSGNLVYVEKAGSDNNRTYPKGKIIKDLGLSGIIGTEKKALHLQYELKDKFSKKIVDSVSEIPGVKSQQKFKNRVDLQNEIIFTIDGEDARDYDDAVGIRKVRNGYKLWVSIADVSHYVRYKSPLDNEAYKRATSTYLPKEVVPMLPERLSNDLCSLVPNKPRFTKTAEITFDLNGKINSYKIYKSVIKSYSRLTYNLVSEALRYPSKRIIKNKALLNKLKLMHELYKKIKKLRRLSGELDFDFPETKLIRDKDENVVDVKKSERNVAHGIIEEFMIVANSVVAQYIFKKNTPSIYRIHEQPDEESIMELKGQLEELGIKVNLSSKVKPKEIQYLMNKVKKRNDRDFIYHTILRSLKKAEYSTRHILHFGLSLQDYTHFTSPIRRYPDLIVHRILDELLFNRENPYELDTLKKLAEHCSIRERKAEEVEREFVNLECVNFMKDRVGENFNAKVISIHPFGVFIELDEYFVEGLIPKATYRGRGKKRKWFNIADKVQVKLVEADMEKRRLTFNLLH